jgi:putative peptidoglycan lipid II flippase
VAPGVEVEAAAEQPRASRIGAAALLLAASVLLSRLLGYGREALLAYLVGAGALTDAYYAAFQIPDLLNHLLAGGALSIAFLPLYTKHLARGDTGAADRLLSTVLGTLTALAVVATLLLWWFAEPLVALQFPRFAPETQATTVHLTRIVLPAQVLFIVGGIVNATLFAQGRFGAAALAPLLYNAGIIAGGLVLAPLLPLPVEGFAWGVLGGALLGPFLAPLAYAHRRVRLRARIAPFDREFLAYLLVAAPLIFGQTLLTIDEWYGRWFGALLGAGAVSHLSYARRLMQVPVAVVGQAIGAAALPTLSRLYAERRHDELNRVMLRTLQASIALALLAGGGCFALATPLVRAVYQRGAFTAADASAVADLLALLCFSVPAWIAQQIIVRAFYARADTWRPMLLGTVVSLGAIPLYLGLGHSLGVRGLALAPALAMTINALATLALARWLHGAPALATLGATTLRAAAIAIGASLLVRWLTGHPPDSFSAALVQLAGGGTLFVVLCAAGIAMFGDEPMRATQARLAGRVTAWVKRRK